MSWLCGFAVFAWLSACSGPVAPSLTGYVEGEYVWVAPVFSARIESILVRRGERVSKGSLLAELEEEDAKLDVLQAEARLAEARSQHANMSKGLRRDEIAAMEATLSAARAQLREAQLAFNRARNLYSQRISSKASYDQAEAARATAEAKVREIAERLEVARTGARPDELRAQEQKIREAEALLEAARWRLRQRRLTAPANGEVSDILLNSGEIAGPASPVLSFLPERAIKLTLFAAEGDRAVLTLGARLSIFCDGCPGGLAATITYVAREPEFTPPVIYSVDRRQKLTYRVEARPEQADSVLQPGLIVDARLAMPTSP
jgi:HlyD family secretion protein